MIGNAVPVNLAYEVALVMKRIVKNCINVQKTYNPKKKTFIFNNSLNDTIIAKKYIIYIAK